MGTLPLGYRFMPTDEEIILHFLFNKVSGKPPLPYGYGTVPDCDLYGEMEPWLIFDKSSNDHFHVFTRLKGNKNNSRFSRTVGCGTWVNQRTARIHDRTGRSCIGFKKMLVFQENKDPASVEKARGNGHWIMHEFSINLPQCQEFVLCRIHNKDANKIKRTTTSFNNQQPRIEAKEYQVLMKMDHSFPFVEANLQQLQANYDNQYFMTGQGMEALNVSGYEGRSSEVAQFNVADNIVADQTPTPCQDDVENMMHATNMVDLMELNSSPEVIKRSVDPEFLAFLSSNKPSN